VNSQIDMQCSCMCDESFRSTLHPPAGPYSKSLDIVLEMKESLSGVYAYKRYNKLSICSYNINYLDNVYLKIISLLHAFV